MFYRNNLLFGALMGLVTPFVSLAVLMMLNDKGVFAWIVKMLGKFFKLFSGAVQDVNEFQFDEKTLFVFAVCCNLIPFRFYRKHRLDLSLNGIVLTTFLYVIVFFIWYMYFPSITLHTVKQGY